MLPTHCVSETDMRKRDGSPRPKQLLMTTLTPILDGSHFNAMASANVRRSTDQFAWLFQDRGRFTARGGARRAEGLDRLRLPEPLPNDDMFGDLLVDLADPDTRDPARPSLHPGVACAAHGSSVCSQMLPSGRHAKAGRNTGFTKIRGETTDDE